ncbi:hypothetical protein DW936_00270 [Odoribacter splanchnicus]|nr:hypothetical protein DW936_00270 [Odoribacter splanchnicus]
MYEYKRAGTTHPAITTKYFVCFRETFTSLIFKTRLPSPDIQTGNQTFKLGGLMFVLAFQSDDLQFISPAMASVRDWRYFPKECRILINV